MLLRVLESEPVNKLAPIDEQLRVWLESSCDKVQRRKTEKSEARLRKIENENQENSRDVRIYYFTKQRVKSLKYS